jgi:hypothetical protein
MLINTSSFPFRRHALALALATGGSNAATLGVSGTCNLVIAINNANTDTDTDGAGVGCKAGSGADIINLTANADSVLTGMNNYTDGPNGLPSVSSVITINGNGATITGA